MACLWTFSEQMLHECLISITILWSLPSHQYPRIQRYMVITLSSVPQDTKIYGHYPLISTPGHHDIWSLPSYQYPLICTPEHHDIWSLPSYQYPRTQRYMVITLLYEHSISWKQDIYFYFLLMIVTDIITKLPESGMLCGNITEFGVAEHYLSPQLIWVISMLLLCTQVTVIKNFNQSDE